MAKMPWKGMDMGLAREKDGGEAWNRIMDGKREGRGKQMVTSDHHHSKKLIHRWSRWISLTRMN